jgi:hypothetical protein
MVRITYGLALMGVVGVLIAGIWAYRIDRSLPSATATAADDRQRDEVVLSHVAEPFTSVEETYRTLRELEQLFRARGDRRAVFPA